MDKTTTWLVRSASLIVILFGIGYVSKPLGNKINSFKEYLNKPDIAGIICNQDQEILNNSDEDIFSIYNNFDSRTGYFRLFDKKTGELYLYNKESKSYYSLQNYQVIRSIEDGDIEDIVTDIGYIKDSFLYVDTIMLVEGNQTKRAFRFKVNLKTPELIPADPEIDGSLYKCRNIQLPNNIEIKSAEEIYFEEF